MPDLLIDTHCHLNFDNYKDDFDEIIARAQEVGVTRIIIPAVDGQTAREALNLTRQYAGIYAAVGVHPNSTANFDVAMLQDVEALAKNDKVIAIGEIGLDYYWDDSPKAKQFEGFEAQLQLAAQLELPVIIHNRNASDDVIAILENWVKPLPNSLKHRPGVLHSVSAPLAIVERALQVDFYMGFTGPITFKKADELRSVAAATPLERILVETDGPFLTPHPYRGKRNEPAYIPYIIEQLAIVKNLSVEVVTRATTENAVRLFRLPESK